MCLVCSKRCWTGRRLKKIYTISPGTHIRLLAYLYYRRAVCMDIHQRRSRNSVCLSRTCEPLLDLTLSETTRLLMPSTPWSAVRGSKEAVFTADIRNCHGVQRDYGLCCSSSFRLLQSRKCRVTPLCPTMFHGYVYTLSIFFTDHLGLTLRDVC